MEAQVIQLNDYREADQFEGYPFERLKGFFREAEEALQEQRRLAFRDRDYFDNFDNDQWTDAEKRTLRRRKQQVSTDNQIKRKINGVLGYEQKSRSDPKVWPLKPGQDRAAEIATHVLDYIENNTRFDRKASKTAKDLAISGVEAVHMEHGAEGIEITPITYDRFFYDPRSLEEDFSDARYMGYAEWLNLEDAQHLYPEHEDDLKSAVDGSGGYDEGFEDKPYGVYVDTSAKRVRIVVVYYRKPDGSWCLAHFTSVGVLYEGESPWMDVDGKSACGIIAESLYIDRKGRRYGMVRDDISRQDEINQRKSRSLHLLKDRRTWGVKGFAQDVNAFKEAVSRPDGHAEVNAPMGQGWGLLENNSEVSGNLELLQQAIASMEVAGIYQPGDSGRAQDQSGRAIIALQNAGLTAENGFFDAHNDFKVRVYRRMWAMARQFWTDEKSIRVTGEQDAAEFVTINQPLGYGPDGVLVVNNPISQIDVDITIEAGPDTMLLQQEQFEMLVQILPQLAQLPPPMAMMIIEASQIRNKKEVKQAMEEMWQMATPQADPLDAADKEAGIMEKQAKAQKAQADARKTMVETAGAFADYSTGGLMQ